MGTVFVDRKTDTRRLDGANRNPNQVGRMDRDTMNIYVSKRVSFDNAVAGDLRVFLDISPNAGTVMVHAKPSDNDGNSDGLVYKEMVTDDTGQNGDREVIGGDVELKTYAFRPQDDDSLGGFSDSFTSYAIKITMTCPNGTPESELPVVKNLRAIAISSP
jgi:hypothetical protein